MEGFYELVTTHTPQIVGGTTIIVLSWLLAFAARGTLRRLISAVGGAKRIRRLVCSVVYYTIIVVGLLTGLSTMGVKTGPIIASLGLGGFALGFALKDVISNFLAGALILVYHPFKEGDFLTVGGCQGTVLETNMRYTVLVEEGTTHMVPNSTIFTNPLKLKTEEVTISEHAEG